MSEGYVNHLTPPSGTTCFKYQEIVVYDDTLEKNGGKSRAAWKANTYIYPTGASVMDKQGWAAAGRLQVVVVHTGDAEVLSGAINEQNFYMGCTGAQLLLPETGSGVVEGDNNKYTINFSKTMNVFQGQTPLAFNAEYQSEVYHYKSKQEGDLKQHTDDSYTKIFVGATGSQLSRNDVFGLSLFTLPTGYYGDVNFSFWYGWRLTDGFGVSFNPKRSVQMPPIPSSSE